MWAIIGGSGFENFDGFETVEELSRETPFGLASSGLRKVRMEGQEILFVSRHGARHELTPSEVNYRANIFALKKYGARRLMSISAVGSLREELKPGDMVVSSQYIDRTKSRRENTFCGDGMVGHISLAYPVHPQWIEYMSSVASQFDFDIHWDKTHIVIEGPTFSTRAESLLYRSWNADIIGMTNAPEVALAREAGISYLPMSFVTDYDCWKDDAPHVTLQEVIAVMRQNNQKAYRVASHMIQNCDLFSGGCSEEGLKNGIMSARDSLTAEQREWLAVLEA